MATEEADQSYLELYDVEKKEKVASAPLAGIRFLPRTGERIFIPVKGPGDWKLIPSSLSNTSLAKWPLVNHLQNLAASPYTLNHRGNRTQPPLSYGRDDLVATVLGYVTWMELNSVLKQRKVTQKLLAIAELSRPQALDTP
jgi:hypothetical protein